MVIGHQGEGAPDGAPKELLKEKSCIYRLKIIAKSEAKAVYNGIFNRKVGIIPRIGPTLFLGNSQKTTNT